MTRCCPDRCHTGRSTDGSPPPCPNRSPSWGCCSGQPATTTKSHPGPSHWCHAPPPAHHPPCKYAPPPPQSTSGQMQLRIPQEQGRTRHRIRLQQQRAGCVVNVRLHRFTNRDRRQFARRVIGQLLTRAGDRVARLVIGVRSRRGCRPDRLHRLHRMRMRSPRRRIRIGRRRGRRTHRGRTGGRSKPVSGCRVDRVFRPIGGRTAQCGGQRRCHHRYLHTFASSLWISTKNKSGLIGVRSISSW
jgi:hypothetical protein